MGWTSYRTMTQSRGKRSPWSSTTITPGPAVPRMGQQGLQSSWGRFCRRSVIPVAHQGKIRPLFFSEMTLLTHPGRLAFLWQKEIQHGAYFGGNMEQLWVFLRYTSRPMRPFRQGKQIFFLQGSSRLLQAIELPRFSSLLAKPHAATTHVPSQLCFLDKQNILRTPRANPFLPYATELVWESTGGQLHPTNAHWLFNCNYLNPCNQCHCSLT